ncbi:MAG: asparaginase [Actinomycetota bacterium]|nr:asparaginase [Actinomycetota bacterium]
MPSPPSPVPIAEYTRSGMVEGVHVGHVAIVDGAGAVVRSWGDPGQVIYPRSANKPVQAAAMVGSGLDLPPRLLALAASSHSGEPFHLSAVRDILAHAGLDETWLQTPPDWPLDPVERDAWLGAGQARTSVAMNCSGKHAAMLATCVAQGWSLHSYRDPAHPLQVAIAARLASLAGEPIAHTGVDGCGAPVLAISLAGLARSAARLVLAEAGSPEGQVAAAMRDHPDVVGGTRRDVTEFMRAVPGLMAKDGAAGVYVAALPDGTAIAVKVEDGSDAARRVVLAEVLIGLGADPGALAGLREEPVFGGGEAVGRLHSLVG